MLLERIGRGQPHESMVEQGSERQALLPRENVVSGRDEDESVSRKRIRLQFAEIDDIRHHANVGEPLCDGSNDFVARFFLDIHVNPTMICKKLIERLRQEFTESRCVRLHADPALQPTGVL